MAKSKKQKISKKSLIELFESKIHPKSVANIEFDKSRKSCLTGQYGNEWIAFCNERVQEVEIGMLGYIDREDYCHMRVVKYDVKYFLEFNSLFVEITMTEFLRLQKMFTKKQSIYHKTLEDRKINQDMILLQKAFAEKTEIETRKIIIEKAPKKTIL